MSRSHAVQRSSGRRRADRSRELEVSTSGFFVLRTPLLPFAEYERWSAGVERLRSLDTEVFADSLAEMRTLLRRRLQELAARPEIEESLYLASPSLIGALNSWRKEPTSKKGRRAEESLVRYFTRMTSRPTPFGLFSGCSTGELSEQTEIRLVERANYERSTRLDMDYLDRLCRTLEANAEIRQHVTLRPNSSLYEVADRLRYAEAREQGSGSRRRSYNLVSVDADEYLSAVLDRARSGASLSELFQTLHDCDTELDPHEALDFIHELIDSQLLITEVNLGVTGEAPTSRLSNTLRRSENTLRAAEVLERVGAELTELDRSGVGGGRVSTYSRIATRLGELPAKVERERLVQVDMFKPAEFASLGPEVLDCARLAIDVLSRITPATPDHLTGFRQEFRKRYGDGRAVPLVEVLDEETGIGFQRSASPTMGDSPLLAGLPFATPKADHPLPWRSNQTTLLEKLWRQRSQDKGALELNEKDVELLATSERPRLPGAFHAMFALAARSPSAARDGDFQLLFRGCGGPSGARMLGRFCHLDPRLEECVRDHLSQEESLEDGLHAEVVHLPQGRTGNVIFRPCLREYEIPYLGSSGLPEDRQIPVTDLWVSLVGDEIRLISERLGQRIIPRLTSAHNYASGSLGIYNFLCCLQSQGTTEGLGWRWDALESLDSLPRVTYQRVVLARAQWRLSRKELEEIAAEDSCSRFQAVQKLRDRRRLPRQLLLVDSDQELLIDLENPLSIDCFVGSTKKRTAVLLRELFPGPEELWVEGPEGRYLHEILVPFVQSRQDRPRPSSPFEPGALRRSTGARGERIFSPGSPWLFAKWYVGRATSDRVLRETVAPLVAELQASGAIDGWFFVRYGDPDWHLRLRFHGSPDRLQWEAIQRIQDAGRELLEAGTIWRVQFDTYERELERYAGWEGIDLVERIFHLDSHAAVELLRLLEESDDPELRWKLTLLGTDRLLGDLGLLGGEKLELLERQRQALGQELGIDRSTRKVLAARLRKHRRELELLLADKAAGLYSQAYAVLDRRSQGLGPLVSELRSRVEARHRRFGWHQLYGSLAHMFNNRMHLSNGRAQEAVLYDFLLQIERSNSARNNSAQRRPKLARDSARLSGHNAITVEDRADEERRILLPSVD